MKTFLIQGNTFSICYEVEELDEEIGKKLFKDFESTELSIGLYALNYPFPEPKFFCTATPEGTKFWVSFKQTHVYESDPLENDFVEEE